MNKPREVWLWILAATTLAIFFAIQHSYLATLIIHNLINLYASGRSLVKVDLFLWYTCFLAILGIFLPRIKKLGDANLSTKWLLVSVTASLIYNLTLLLVFFHKWGFKINSYVLTFHNGELSSTRLLHNHVMKGVNGTLLNFFGAASQENADTGFAYLGMMSQIWFWIGSILVLVSLVLLVWKFIELHKQQTQFKPLFIVTYSIVSFSLLKNMLDGGLLNRETPIALTALIFILLLSSNKRSGDGDKQKVSYWLATLPILIYGLLVTMFHYLADISIASLPYKFLKNTIYASLIGALIFWQQASWKKIDRLKFWLGVGLTIFCIALLSRPLEGSIETYLNSRRIIGTQGAIVSLYNPPNYARSNPEDWKLIEKIGDLTYYEVHPQDPTKINELLTNNNLLANALPIQIPGVTCPSDHGKNPITFTLLTEQKLLDDNSQHQFGNITKITPIGTQNSLQKYQVEMELEGCTPRIIMTVEELLESRGINTFFITNLSDTYFPVI